MARRRLLGFTLIELMVVVVIVGILASIAYPSYTSFMRETRRSDAQIALLKVAADQEKFNSDCNTYASSLTNARSCAALGLGRTNNLSPDSYYQLSVAIAASGAQFTATATPVAGGAQAADTSCASFGIDELGNKTATGANPTKCWKK